MRLSRRPAVTVTGVRSIDRRAGSSRANCLRGQDQAAARRRLRLGYINANGAAAHRSRGGDGRTPDERVQPAPNMTKAKAAADKLGAQLGTNRAAKTQGAKVIDP